MAKKTEFYYDGEWLSPGNREIGVTFSEAYSARGKILAFYIAAWVSYIVFGIQFVERDEAADDIIFEEEEDWEEYDILELEPEDNE